jgi:hypothetical protein
MAMLSAALPHHAVHGRRHRWSALGVSVLAWTLFLGAVTAAGMALAGTGLAETLGLYALVYWLGALAAHHSQLVEHGNLIVDGDLRSRNLASRNLMPGGLAARLFLFLTHGDAREHVLHHLRPAVHNRPFPGRVPLPPDAVRMGLRDYAGVLGDMLRGQPSAR